MNNNTGPYCEEVAAPDPAPVITPSPTSVTATQLMITPAIVTSTVQTPTPISASSPRPPVYVVTTNPATNISATYAVLHGTVTQIEPAYKMHVDDYLHWNGYSADKTWSFDIHTYNFVYGGQYSIEITIF